MSLCDTFQRLAFQTWDKIEASRTVNFQLKEETFTDINMLELKIKHPNQVISHVFTKKEEGINGADWEWWLKGFSGKWIGFRVQAKILNIYSNKFEELNYKTRNNKRYQCDKLIENAANSKVPTIPLYCFYLQIENCQHGNPNLCISAKYGCSLALALNVQSLRISERKRHKNIWDYIFPWHFLVCNSSNETSDIIWHIRALFKKSFMFGRGILERFRGINIDEFIVDSPPKYVLSLIEKRNNYDIETSDEDLHGIMIYIEEEPKTIQNFNL